MQPHVSAAPVILVMGPSGSEVKVRGTQDLRPPYPLEGDYMEVVFLRSGGAVVPATAQADQAASGTALIIGVWLAWGAAIAGGLLGARYLLDTGRPWWPRAPRRSTIGRQRVAVRRGVAVRQSVAVRQGVAVRLPAARSASRLRDVVRERPRTQDGRGPVSDADDGVP